MSKKEKMTMSLIFMLFGMGIAMLLMQDYILGR